METPSITIKGILEFAIAIEEESAAYYKSAIEKNLYDPKDPVHIEIIGTLEQLVLEEIKHKSRLKVKLVEFKERHDDVVEKPLQSLMDAIVAIEPLPIDASPRMILERAHEREIRTMSLYQMLGSLSELGDIGALFDELVNQERGHASRIASLITALG